MNDDAALIARVHDKHKEAPFGALPGYCHRDGQRLPCDALALCALAERVPELERAVEHEVSSYRRFVKHVESFTGGSLLHYKELLAYRDEIERLRQLAEDRVAALEADCKGYAFNLDQFRSEAERYRLALTAAHEVLCTGDEESRNGVPDMLAEALGWVAPRRDADGAEGANA